MKILTALFSARIAKALPTVLGMLLGPEVIEAFQQGVTDGGLTPAAYALGVLLGGILAGGTQWLIMKMRARFFPAKDKDA